MLMLDVSFNFSFKSKWHSRRTKYCNSLCYSIVLCDISKIYHDIFLPDIFKGNEVLFYFHFYLNPTKFTCTNNNFKKLRVLASIICPKDNDKF